MENKVCIFSTKEKGSNGNSQKKKNCQNSNPVQLTSQEYEPLQIL